MNIVPLRHWEIFPQGSPFVIAGPCSAESKEQVMQSASFLSNAGVGVMRAGVWKPRTRPGCFEGAGAAALEWLRCAKECHGVKLCCEVASADGVQSCLDAGIDMLWIGARTSVNPFLVQEIASALRGTDVPVLVKNPVNYDVGLWIGAFERLYDSGLRRLGAVHRGVSSEGGKYRNDPAWTMAVALRSSLPEIPLLCDPSHMGGRREYVRELSQYALNLGFDGLMIEVHPCPQQALSDAQQQLSPEEFKSLFVGPDALVARNGDEDGIRIALASLRCEIDEVDEKLLECLSRRMAVSEKIGRFKRENNIAILQSDRWESVLARVVCDGGALGLDEAFVRRIFSIIHQQSVSVQQLEK